MGARHAVACTLVLAGSALLAACAGLAALAPSLRVQATARRRLDARDTLDTSERWSWSVDVSLAGWLDPEPPASGTTRGPTLPLAIATASPCRLAALCAWESHARAEALARAVRALRQTEAP